MTDSPLSLRVLCLGRGIAAAYAQRLVADLGAECSWWRWSPPRPGDWPEDKLFLSFFEQGVEIADSPLALDALLATLPSVAASFDLLITDFTASEMAEGALYAALAPFNPRLVVANCDHFGRTGPYAEWQGDELTDYAMGGYWAIAGDSAREPLRVPGYQAQFHAGMQLTIAALAAARYAETTGQGQEVEATGVEAMLGAHWSTTVAWTHEGRILTRAGRDVFRAKDGWVFFYQMAFYPGILVLIDQPELMDDPRWTTVGEWLVNAPQLWSLVEAWCADHLVDEIVQAAQELRIPVTPVQDAQRLLDDAALEERGYFRTVDGKRLPGNPARWEFAWETRAPDRLQSLLANPPRPVRQAPEATVTPPAERRGGPLAGLRVLELTNNWAGPIAGRHLGDLGAEVIKIELATKPATRGSHYPGKIPGKYHWNRSGYFNEMNRNKRGLSLNLATDRGREIFLDLVRQADVVIENNSSRVMPNLGVGYETLKQVNPRIIMASISGFGGTGARRDWVAFGSNIEAASGLAAITGYAGDDTPFRTGSFVADPIGGAQAVISVLAALGLRDRTGEGCHIDLSLIEVALPFMLLGFTHLQGEGKLLRPNGNRERDDAPTGAYPCGSNDDWVAIAVRTDGQYAALVKLTGGVLPAAPDRAARVALRDEIDTRLAAWTKTLAPYECVRMLQGAGIPAAQVLHNWQLHSDPHLFARNAFIPIDHPDTGVFPYPGFPWRLTHTPPSVRTAAPRFGEGNQYVFRSILGLNDEQVAALYEAGVTTDAPIGLPFYG